MEQHKEGVTVFVFFGAHPEVAEIALAQELEETYLCGSRFQVFLH